MIISRNSRINVLPFNANFLMPAVFRNARRTLREPWILRRTRWAL